ncbi:MAG TPA: TetR family transcriptional regulator, partial [Pseudonocardiaceae bacterium]|nr:TetR family transcriptional regulator [Pseudonocardiaceae bacterium]
ARYRVGGYLVWQQHVRTLLEQARSDMDADCVAHLVLAGLAADLRRAIRDEYPAARATDAVLAMANLVLTGHPK